MSQSLASFFKSFFHAGRGIILGLRGRNMKVHILAAIIVIILSSFLKLSTNEWIIILTLITLVFASELVNSSIEELANVVKEHNKCDYQATRDTRDFAAGAVLFISIFSALVGLIILGPKVISFIDFF